MTLRMTTHGAASILSSTLNVLAGCFFKKSRKNFCYYMVPKQGKIHRLPQEYKILYSLRVLRRKCPEYMDLRKKVAEGWTKVTNDEFNNLYPAGAGNFFLCHRVQNGSGAHPASYPMGTRGSFLGSKAAGA
jgi:hypothetical protein